MKIRAEGASLSLLPGGVVLLALALVAGCAAGSSVPATAPAPPAAVAPARVAPAPESPGWASLFPAEGVPTGWNVRNWNDISQPAPTNAAWRVENGVLRGGVPRGTWLVSEQSYGDFILQFECRLGARGNSGVGLRLPSAGEPAVQGLEVQIVDPRYYGANYKGEPWDFTGAIYRLVAPSTQRYLPLDWNRFTIVCQGSRVTVTVNEELVCETDLDRPSDPPIQGPPLAQRPRRGLLGFQEVSRGNGHVEIRNARIRLLDGP